MSSLIIHALLALVLSLGGTLADVHLGNLGRGPVFVGDVRQQTTLDGTARPVRARCGVAHVVRVRVRGFRPHERARVWLARRPAGGRTVRVRTIRADRHGLAQYRLPLAGLSRGRYLLVMEATKVPGGPGHGGTVQVAMPAHALVRIRLVGRCR